MLPTEQEWTVAEMILKLQTYPSDLKVKHWNSEYGGWLSSFCMGLGLEYDDEDLVDEDSTIDFVGIL